MSTLQRHSTRFLTLACLFSIAVFVAVSDASAAADHSYDAIFALKVDPRRSAIEVELKLTGERLPSRIAFHIDPKRHRAFRSNDSLTTAGTVVTWTPSGREASVRYEFLVNHERSPQRYDSLITEDWAVFRGERLVPRMAVTSRRNSVARTGLQFSVPSGWSIATPYRKDGDIYRVEDGERRFDRPAGWMLVGKLGERSELIDGVQTIVAAPSGESARRQDILAFLNWNLPELKKVFPDFPRRLLIVSAGDPMWRGGLSGPNSLFLHAERPLISENRTSTLLHELVHVAMGIRGDEESDWIVEGIAEYYSLEILRRSGGISRARYREAIDRMTAWAKRSPNVFVRESSGAATARAVIALRGADAEIRKSSGGRASLDDVAAALAARGGEVTLAILQAEARKAAGRDVEALHRQRLAAPLEDSAATSLESRLESTEKSSSRSPAHAGHPHL